MLNKYPLLLLLTFLIFITPFLFLLKFPNIQENFVDKSNEHTFTLKNNQFIFNKSSITITPQKNLKPNLSNLNFSFSSNPPIPSIDSLKFTKMSDLIFTLQSNKNNITINLSFHDNPINIVVNDYEYTIELKNSKKINNTQNIFIYQKLCGNIKDGKILKSIRPEIFENPDIICAIYISYMIFQNIQQIKNIDYDNYFLSEQYES